VSRVRVLFGAVRAWDARVFDLLDTPAIFLQLDGCHITAAWAFQHKDEPGRMLGGGDDIHSALLQAVPLAAVCGNIDDDV
jgi:hypothetical protein